jgi:phenylpyruvate tautomerase PptA (4-oxalocrotonate tautomerase family)
MPFIKAYVPKGMPAPQKQDYMSELRGTLTVLGIDPSHGHVVLIETDPEDRGVHVSRDQNFCILEVALFAGRADAVKHELMKRLTQATLDHVHVQEKDVQVILIDIERRCWSGAGTPFSSKDLGY